MRAYILEILCRIFPNRKGVNIMASRVIGKKIPFAVLYRDGVFILIDIREYFAYENGIRTNKRAGYLYMVVDPVSFDKIEVKIQGQEQPLMSPAELAELRENGEKIIVEFVNGIDKPYNRKVGNTWSVEDSFSADDILLVEEN